MDLTLLLPSNYMELLPRHTNHHNIFQKWMSTSTVDFEDVCELWDYVVDKEEVIPILEQLLSTRPFGVFCKAKASELPDGCQAIIRQEWEKDVDSNLSRCFELIKYWVCKRIFDNEWHKLFPMKPASSSLLLLEDLFSLVRNYLDYDSLKWVRKVCSAWKRFLPIQHYVIVDALLDHVRDMKAEKWYIKVHMIFENSKVQISDHKSNEYIPTHRRHSRFVRRILPIYDPGFLFACTYECPYLGNPTSSCSAFRLMNLDSIQSLKPLLKSDRKKLEHYDRYSEITLWASEQFQSLSDNPYVTHWKDNSLELHIPRLKLRGYYCLEIHSDGHFRFAYLLGFGEQDSHHVLELPFPNLESLYKIRLRMKRISDDGDRDLFEYFPSEALKVTAPYVNICHCLS